MKLQFSISEDKKDDFVITLPLRLEAAPGTREIQQPGFKRSRSKDTFLADCEVEQKDLPVLASYFDVVEPFLDAMELAPHEKGDVRRAAQTDGVQGGISVCLECWRNHNPPAATFAALQDRLLRIGRLDIASRVIKYLVTQQ